MILTAYIHVRIVSHCHLAPPRPFFEYEVLFVIFAYITHCHTVTLPHCNTVRPQQIQIWTASDNDPCMARSLVHWCRTGRHRAQARRQILSIIYTLLYVQGPVCMSEMGPDVQRPEKRLNCHLFAIPTLLLPFLF